MAKPKKHYVDELGDGLSLALGRAVWAFSGIEKLMFEYMKQLSKDDLHDLIGHQTIYKRIEIIKKLINRIKGFDIEKAEATLSLDKIAKFITNRNTLAHNPWLTWIDFERREFVTEIQNVSNPTQKLNLKDVEKFTVDVGELTQELKDKLNVLVKAFRGF